MEFKVEESKKLEDGKYSGIITHIEYRQEPFEYTDVFVKEKITGIELKYGCPSRLSENSKLGKLLEKFVTLVVGSTVDPEKLLVNKEVAFMTMTEKTKDGNKWFWISERKGAMKFKGDVFEHTIIHCCNNPKDKFMSLNFDKGFRICSDFRLKK